MYLFTTPSCPYCPQAKKLLEESTYRFEMIDASRPVGLTMAKRFQIAQVPSLLITDEEGNKARLHSGIESISLMLKNI
jgi:glutaredoxin